MNTKNRTSKVVRLWLATLAASALSLTAQVPDAPAPARPAPAPAPAGGKPGGAQPGQPSFLGKDVPSFDPGSEVLTWDGKSWNVNNNRVFQARFEKYLNSPEETSKEASDYRAILNAILDKLAPQNLTGKSLMDAFKLLPKASGYDIDARLCDSIADTVYSAWSAQNAGQQLAEATVAMDEERKRLEWNAQIASQGGSLSGPPSAKNGAASQQWSKDQQMSRDMKMHPYITRLAELVALQKANQLKKELNKLQTKIEFQTFMVQLFLQRRFQHVLMATRFYRAIFNDGDTKLQVGKDAKDLFSKSIGMPPTVSTLDAMANEAIRDVRESVQAYNFLVEKNELDSATKRLGEAFTIGEYMPEIRTLPREKKRMALAYAQKGNQLISTIEVRDYTLAEKLVKEMKAMAQDFDESKPMAAISTAKTVSAMHLAKARNAALSGDKATLETELKEAAETWPSNPKLQEVAGMIFSQGDVQAKALVDLDQLMSQKNYRQIYDDKLRFIAAVATDPTRQGGLKKVLDNMQIIETAIMKGTEISKAGNYPGAWESVEQAFEQFPEDSKLNQLRANLTTQAADFVRTIRTAEDMEQKDQVGSSLAWYLKAQKIYPASEFAKDGVSRLVKKVLPESEG